MKSLIIGLGKSGLAAYEFLEKKGDIVVGVDDSPIVMQRCGKVVEENPDICTFDRIIVSPGVPPWNVFYSQAVALKKTIVGEAQLAFESIASPSVAITGTNGKTTVVLLIERILNISGKKARALGNIGTPLTSSVPTLEEKEIVIAEISSFQLETFGLASFDFGVILNITPDHLDRHGSMATYGEAKCHLQKCMKKGGKFLVYQDVVREFGLLLEPGFITYGSTKESDYWIDGLAIKRGKYIEMVLPHSCEGLAQHDRENILAAFFVCCGFGVEKHQFIQGVESFKKPSHRLEFVATIEGADYINDSKATNIDATMKGVDSIKENIVLIAGGVDKGASYQSWKGCFGSKVRVVVVIGQAAEKIAKDLSPEYLVVFANTLKEAVNIARSYVRTGERVLFSPGCSSFDMFRNYSHRGDEFKKLIQGVKDGS
jgi:UDP-N-acetylmuramoylalanine--D-glutamate ligase